MVPTLRCGFVRSNFCLALLGDLGGDRRRYLFVPVELHGEICAAL
jgi:hypothetical protein